MSDTIFAPATAPGRAGVAVVRVSGAAAWESLDALCPGRAAEPRRAYYCPLIDNVSRETIDNALVLGFKSPASYTGEDVVEYHLHGGRAVVNALLAALGRIENFRIAEPGEFTRRAFENGKMDLTEAEAVADLINAETTIQKNQALAQMDGALYAIYEGWAVALKDSLAHIEADLEFPDEDMPEGILPRLLPKIRALHTEIEAHLDDNHRGQRLRDGLQVVVIGAPNAGKSSLVNAIARRDVAIVSDLAGTTRDIIEVPLDLEGYPVMLVDTAGLRPQQLGESGHDAIESEGMRRALARAENADIKILLFDGCAEADPYTLGLIDEHSLVVVNKCDADNYTQGFPAACEISASTGKGLDSLLSLLGEKVAELIGTSEAPALTRQRHRAALEECRDALERSKGAELPELAAEDIRLAVRALGRITGRVDVEDLLDVIFRDFCIGK